jgi:nitrate reductase beta subunit
MAGHVRAQIEWRNGSVFQACTHILLHTSRKHTQKYTRMYVNTFARVHASSSTQARPHARAHSRINAHTQKQGYFNNCQPTSGVLRQPQLGREGDDAYLLFEVQLPTH